MSRTATHKPIPAQDLRSQTSNMRLAKKLFPVAHLPAHLKTELLNTRHLTLAIRASLAIQIGLGEWRGFLLQVLARESA